MSTAQERAFRAARHIMPIKIMVKGEVQHVDADTRRRPVRLQVDEEIMLQEVRHALNEYYYGGLS
jgi:hypothetical protein